jgi:hypothetical protein
VLCEYSEPDTLSPYKKYYVAVEWTTVIMIMIGIICSAKSLIAWRQGLGGLIESDRIEATKPFLASIFFLIISWLKKESVWRALLSIHL